MKSLVKSLYGDSFTLSSRVSTQMESFIFRDESGRAEPAGPSWAGRPALKGRWWVSKIRAVLCKRVHNGRASKIKLPDIAFRRRVALLLFLDMHHFRYAHRDTVLINFGYVLDTIPLF